jgi:hypothetical protein
MALTRNEFFELLDRLGPDLTHWPTRAMIDASHLLLRDEQARERLAEAAVEFSFTEEAIPEPPPQLADRIIAAVE